MPSRVPKTSPWGKVQHAEFQGLGITFVSTAEHGGFKLDRERNAQVHPTWRRSGGWYEEDIDWAIVAYTFPEFFEEKELEQAMHTLINWLPHEHMAVTGVRLTARDSFKLAEEEFAAQHANDWVAISATTGSSWQEVPEGYVLVTATLGGVQSGYYGGQRVVAQRRCFLVLESEYAARVRFGFVVDPTRHQEVECR